MRERIPLKHSTRIVRRKSIQQSRRASHQKTKLPPAPSSLQIPDTQEYNDEIYIIGGGSSLINFNFSKLFDKCTLAVNKAVFDVPNPNYFISVDYTFLRKINRSVFDPILAKKFFVADLSFPFMKEVNGEIVDTRYDLYYDLTGFDALVRAHNQKGIGYSFEDFRTGINSGYCALQLSIIFGFKKIYLLGFDLNKKDISHYHGGYGEPLVSFNSKLDRYYDYFKEGLEQLKREKSSIQIMSCSKDSRLNDVIPYINVEDHL